LNISGGILRNACKSSIYSITTVAKLRKGGMPFVRP
jgi:hypothetical protein